MRISDWSSDVCSSDLLRTSLSKLESVICLVAMRASPLKSKVGRRKRLLKRPMRSFVALPASGACERQAARPGAKMQPADRKRVVEGKSVSVSVDLGGRRIIKKKKTETMKMQDYKRKR